MKFNEVKNDKQLWDFMTDPSEGLMRSVAGLKGDIVILGGSGKMGKELTGLLRNADDQIVINRRITVASTFSNPEDLDTFQQLKVTCLKGDLSDEKFIRSLPGARLVIYMLGFKFGSRTDWRKAFHLNSIVPYLIGNRYPDSRIVVFSSGNPYPHTSISAGGCKESDTLDPKGVYGWNIVARESAFATTAMQHSGQKLCYFRLMYAQHLYYGVLVDLARMIWREEPVSLQMPAVNLVSQRDANEIAIRSLEYCANSPWILNVAGPVTLVREIATNLGNLLGKKPRFLDDETDMALLANDDLCLKTFGKYRDLSEEMMESAAWWVMNEQKTWNKPTYFGKVDHNY